MINAVLTRIFSIPKIYFPDLIQFYNLIYYHCLVNVIVCIQLYLNENSIISDIYIHLRN